MIRTNRSHKSNHHKKQNLSQENWCQKMKWDRQKDVENRKRKKNYSFKSLKKWAFCSLLTLFSLFPTTWLICLVLCSFSFGRRWDVAIVVIVNFHILCILCHMNGKTKKKKFRQCDYKVAMVSQLGGKLSRRETILHRKQNMNMNWNSFFHFNFFIIFFLCN